jgi:hypothetical protein
VSNDEAGEYRADVEQIPDDWLPTSARDQSCAVCGDDRVTWLHPLAKDLVEIRVNNSGYTLPTFWTLCDGCESFYAAGKDDQLRTRMQQPDGAKGAWDELALKSLATFRRADLGARAFGVDGPQSS